MVMFTVLLITSVFSQVRQTIYTNDDCTGDVVYQVTRNEECFPESIGCRKAYLVECLDKQQTDAIEVVDTKLPWIVTNVYDTGSNTTCGAERTFSLQQDYLADGACRLVSDKRQSDSSTIYVKASCNSTLAIFDYCFDKNCTNCRTHFEEPVGVCKENSEFKFQSSYSCLTPKVSNTTATSSATTTTVTTEVSKTTSSVAATSSFTATSSAAETNSETTGCDKSSTTVSEPTETGIISSAVANGFGLVVSAMMLMNL